MSYFSVPATRAAHRWPRGSCAPRVTLCDRQKERSCPIFPGAIWRLHWDLEDPSRVAAPGDRREAMRLVRDDIQRHVMDFVKKNGVTKGKKQQA